MVDGPMLSLGVTFAPDGSGEVVEISFGGKAFFPAKPETNDPGVIPRDGTHILIKRTVFRYISPKGRYEPCGEKWEECLWNSGGSYWQPYEGDSYERPLNTTDTFGDEIIKGWRPLP